MIPDFLKFGVQKKSFFEQDVTIFQCRLLKDEWKKAKNDVEDLRTKADESRSELRKKDLKKFFN